MQFPLLFAKFLQTYLVLRPDILNIDLKRCKIVIPDYQAFLRFLDQYWMTMKRRTILPESLRRQFNLYNISFVQAGNVVELTPTDDVMHLFVNSRTSQDFAKGFSLLNRKVVKNYKKRPRDKEQEEKKEEKKRFKNLSNTLAPLPATGTISLPDPDPDLDFTLPETEWNILETFPKMKVYEKDGGNALRIVSDTIPAKMFSPILTMTNVFTLPENYESDYVANQFDPTHGFVLTMQQQASL